MTKLVRIAISGPVLRIVLDSQHNRNALSTAVIDEMHVALDIASVSARGVVIEAVGPSFCSGADLQERDSGVAEHRVLLGRIASMEVPVIAIVDGAVRAGGLGLVAAADLAIATERATFAASEVQRGLVPAIISAHLRRVVGFRSLQRHLPTGDVFGAAEEAAMGLVTVAARAEEVRPWVDGLIASLVTAGPQAVRIRRVVLADQSAAWDADLARLEEVSTSVFARKEATEGIAASLERRARSTGLIPAERGR